MSIDKGIEQKLNNDMLTFAASKHPVQITGFGAATKELRDMAHAIYNAPTGIMAKESLMSAAAFGIPVVLATGDALSGGLSTAAGATIGAINSFTKPRTR